MKVFKFGGASVNSVERIRNLAAIVKRFSSDQLVIIISAMGKVTNELEKVVETFYEGNKDESLALFGAVKQYHTGIARELLQLPDECLAQLNDFFTEVEWLLHDKPVREFDYYYDQVVCAGELMSTSIVSRFLSEAGTDNRWLDVRDMMRTDNNFRDANIDWEVTSERVRQHITPENRIYITQGFIGATDDNESTTLGREGSDYTAAIFANILDAESLSIWKDVEGVMNADPKLFPVTELIPELNFTEVIEMAFYGAQVIHPKTIKPLQNKGIPLHVKCFLDPSLPGTIIHDRPVRHLPPVIVVKNGQALLQLKSRDFSFVGEEPISLLYRLFGQTKTRPNLIQTGAISVQVCMDDRSEKIAMVAEQASTLFDVQVEKGLSLLTIRHYTPAIVEELTKGKSVVLTQSTKQTIQVLYS